MCKGKAAAILYAFASTAAAAQESAPPRLDFLVGKWTLHDVTGKQVGHSCIVAQVPGTMLFEQRTVGDGKPQPLWFENAERHGGWTQLFVGPKGMTREFVPASVAVWPMVMGSRVTLQDGTQAQFRMTLTRESGNHTRRLLEISRDLGDTWRTVFDYHYRRAAVSSEEASTQTTGCSPGGLNSGADAAGRGRP